MKQRSNHLGRFLLSLIFIAATSCVYCSDEGKAPVKVYILSGQSNMVGIGQVDAGAHRWGKEFINPVLSVDTRPFYRPPEVSPRNQGFHYHGNAETYMLVGEGMGKVMVELKK